jgi:nucleotide-binding universal stress UspA family protein
MFKTIIWATDGSEAADCALPYAKSLANGQGHALVVVHNKELLRGRAGGYPMYADEDELQEKIRRQAEEIREEGVDVMLKIETGAAPGAAHMIADAAHEVDADVIVVGTRGHTAIGGLLLGSVTQRLLHISPCPVLAVPAAKDAASALEPEREKVEVAQ